MSRIEQTEGYQEAERIKEAVLKMALNHTPTGGDVWRLLHFDPRFRSLKAQYDQAANYQAAMLLMYAGIAPTPEDV